MKASGTWRPFRYARAVLILVSSVGVAAVGQDSSLTLASVETCNLSGTVSVSVMAGTIPILNQTFPLDCLNETTMATVGVDERSLAGEQVALPIISDLANLEGMYGRSEKYEQPAVTGLRGVVTASNVGLPGLTMSGVSGQSDCKVTAGSADVRCDVETTGTVATTSGEDPLNLASVPVNSSVPIVSLPLDVGLPGLGLVSIPVSGVLLLNRVEAVGFAGGTLQFTHSPYKLTLQGQTSVLVGQVDLSLEIGSRVTTRMSRAGEPWSQVIFPGACSDTCGGCGTRPILHLPESGQQLQSERCNFNVCRYPRATCCSGFRRAAVDGRFVCVPVAG